MAVLIYIVITIFVIFEFIASNVSITIVKKKNCTNLQRMLMLEGPSKSLAPPSTILEPFVFKNDTSTGSSSIKSRSRRNGCSSCGPFTSSRSSSSGFGSGGSSSNNMSSKCSNSTSGSRSSSSISRNSSILSSNSSNISSSSSTRTGVVVIAVLAVLAVSLTEVILV